MNLKQLHEKLLDNDISPFERNIHILHSLIINYVKDIIIVHENEFQKTDIIRLIKQQISEFLEKRIPPNSYVLFVRGITKVVLKFCDDPGIDYCNTPDESIIVDFRL